MKPIVNSAYLNICVVHFLFSMVWNK